MKKILLSLAGLLVALAGGYGINEMGSARSQSLLYPVMVNVATTTQGVILDTTDYRHVECSVDWDEAATSTIKFAGSLAETAPDFTAAASSTNQYDFIQMADIEDGSSIDGDTGVSVAGGTDHRMFEANLNGATWFTAVQTYTSGASSTVKCRLFTNQ